MSEEEVSYASVVFKAHNAARPRVKKEEETVYDEVKVQTQKTLCPHGFKSNGKEAGGRRSCGCVICFMGGLCAVLLLVIIGICVHIFTLTQEKEMLQENQSYLQAVNWNLTLLKSSLSSANENLTAAFADSQRKITGLNSEIRKLNDDKAELATEKNNLIQQLQNEPERNISRAQWSVKEYCLNHPWGECHSCQSGWDYYSSCYKVVNPAGSSLWKTWEQARQDCRDKMADLVVINGDYEKGIVSYLSAYSSRVNGYWIGLRVINGAWQWADGSALDNNFWSQEPVAGHCAVSVQTNKWTSVPCDRFNRWICEKKSLTV